MILCMSVLLVTVSFYQGFSGDLPLRKSGLVYAAIEKVYGILSEAVSFNGNLMLLGEYIWTAQWWETKISSFFAPYLSAQPPMTGDNPDSNDPAPGMKCYHPVTLPPFGNDRHLQRTDTLRSKFDCCFEGSVYSKITPALVSRIKC